MARTRLALLASLVLLLGPSLHAIGARAADAGQRIREVRIEGAERLSPESLASRLTLKAGDTFDATRADDSIKALFATGQLDDASLTLEGGVLVVRISEAPLVNSVAVTGNSAIETKDILAAARLKQGQPFTRARAQDDIITLRRLYRAKGRLGTTVTPRTTRTANGAVDVSYDIVESKVDKVTAIRFVGNSGLSERDLKSAIRTAESGWLDILKGDAAYDPERIEQDRELLLAHYRKSGYPDAKIISAEATPAADGTGYLVTFTIEEGDAYTIGDVSIESRVTDVDRDTLMAEASVTSGARYDASALARTQQRFALFLAKSGHPFTEVRLREDRDREARSVRVTFEVVPAQHILIERIEIRGNTKTRDPVVRRSLKLAEGDAYNPLLVAAARSRLQATGYFKTVAIDTKRGSAADRIALEVGLEEQDTRNLGFGVGFSENEGIIGDVSFEERNLFGYGQAAKVKLAGSLQRFEGEVSLIEPHLAGTDVSGGVSGFYKDSDKTRESSFKTERLGGSASLGYAITDHWSGQVRYMLSRNTLYDVGPAASTAVKEALTENNGTAITSEIGYSATYDTRDTKRLPTQGTIFSLGQDFAGLGGDVRYVRSTADLRTYYPVSESITLAGRLQGGMITGWGGDEVRLLDMFYRGNDLVRGFAASGLGPRDTLSANADALGGTAYYGASLAAQFDLPLVPKDIGLRGEVFADAGSLFGVNSTAASLPGVQGAKHTVRASVGAGLIWDSPIGPLRADYAIPVVSQGFDKVQPLSFGLGQF